MVKYKALIFSTLFISLFGYDTIKANGWLGFQNLGDTGTNVEIDFQTGKCTLYVYGPSYKVKNNVARKGASITYSFDYVDCDGKTVTIKEGVNLDNIGIVYTGEYYGKYISRPPYDVVLNDPNKNMAKRDMIDKLNGILDGLVEPIENGIKEIHGLPCYELSTGNVVKEYAENLETELKNVRELKEKDNHIVDVSLDEIQNEIDEMFKIKNSISGYIQSAKDENNRIMKERNNKIQIINGILDGLIAPVQNGIAEIQRLPACKLENGGPVLNYARKLQGELEDINTLRIKYKGKADVASDEIQHDIDDMNNLKNSISNIVSNAKYENNRIINDEKNQSEKDKIAKKQSQKFQDQQAEAQKKQDKDKQEQAKKQAEKQKRINQPTKEQINDSILAMNARMHKEDEERTFGLIADGSIKPISFTKHPGFAMNISIGFGVNSIPLITNSTGTASTGNITPYSNTTTSLNESLTESFEMWFYRNRFFGICGFEDLIYGYDFGGDNNSFSYFFNYGGKLILGKDIKLIGEYSFGYLSAEYDNSSEVTSYNGYETFNTDGSTDYKIQRIGLGLMADFSADYEGTFTYMLYMDRPDFFPSTQSSVWVHKIYLRDRFIDFFITYSHNYAIGGNANYQFNQSNTNQDLLMLGISKTGTLTGK